MKKIIFLLLVIFSKLIYSFPFGVESPLIRAIVQNKPHAVQNLLDQGFNVNQNFVNGATALMVASSVGNSNIVSMLLLRRAKLNSANQDGNTALIAAAASGQFDVAKLLLRHGAKPCQRNKEGLLPYEMALRWGNHESARKLRSTCKPRGGG